MAETFNTSSLGGLYEQLKEKYGENTDEQSAALHEKVMAEFYKDIGQNHIEKVIETVPVKHRDSRFSNFRCDLPGLKIIKKKAISIINKYNIVLVCGDTHRGKTHILRALQYEFLQRRKSVFYEDYSYVHGLFSAPRTTNNNNIEYAVHEHIRQMTAFDVIMIDDLNRKVISNFVLENIFDLIKKVEANKTKIIIVSNLKEIELLKAFGFFWEKINSRMKGGNGLFINFNEQNDGNGVWKIPEYKKG